LLQLAGEKKIIKC